MTTTATDVDFDAKAFGALDEVGQKSLESELLDLAEECNTSTTGTLRIPSEYLEVVVVRAS